MKFQAQLCVFLFIISFINKSVLSDCNISGLQNETYPLESFLYNNSLVEQCECINKKEESAEQNKNLCIRKCCQKDYILKNGVCVSDKNNTFIKKEILIYIKDEDVMEADLGQLTILPGRISCQRNEHIKFNHPETDDSLNNAFFNKEDGKLWNIETNMYYDYDQYCLEYSEENGGVFVFMCEKEYVEDWNFGDRLSFIGVIISLPFLLVTFIVYALLPQRSLHGSALMCYVLALFTAYFLLAVSPLLETNMTYAGCKIMGMVTLFCFISSIFWMNVMSYDIYSTFKGSRGFEKSSRTDQKRRFLLYSAYAWGVPLTLMGIIMIANNTAKPNTWYDPGVRGEECLLRDGFPELLYFYGPVAVLLGANIVMFIITAIKIRKLQKDTAMLTMKENKKHGSKENDEQYTFGLYIKLLFAMGINWTMEIINWLLTWLVGNVPPAVWYLTDFCNAAYGVVIFFVFVFKKSIWKLLKKRYEIIRGSIETSQWTLRT